jgi:hypothetical protein
MSTLTRNWRYIRILFISTGIISGVILPKNQFPLPWVFSLMVLIVVPLMVLGVVAMNASRLPKFWNLPQWDTNPFLLRTDPFQILHVVAWQAIVAGAVGYLLLPWTGISSVGSATFYMTAGVGFLLGLYLSVYVFRKRFRDKFISAKAVFLGSWQKPKPVK